MTLHIRTLTDQPIALGGVGLARIAPIIVFSLVGGAVADALNRRRVLSGGIGCILAVGWVTRRWTQIVSYNGDEPIRAGATAD